MNEPIIVSLVALLATPERYNGRKVRVVGYYSRGWEHSVLYLHREDNEYGLTQNSVWVALTNEQFAKFAVQQANYVLLEGTFSITMKGHLGAYNSGLTNIQRLEIRRKL